MLVNTARNALVLDAVRDENYFAVVHPNTPTGRLMLRSRQYHQPVSAERPQGGRASGTAKVGWCSRKDIVEAFRIVDEEIRARCRRIEPKALTRAEACRLALRFETSAN